MVNCDLERVFGDLADAVPVSLDGNDGFVFSQQSLPVPPAEMATDQLILITGTHIYHPVWRVDSVGMQAHRRTCRQLGLLILAVVFHELPAQVYVTLSHPSSDIKHLVIEYTYPDEHWPGYRTRPSTFRYWPRETARHPWDGRPASWPRRDLRDLPIFILTNRDDLLLTPEDWARRDTVRGCGSDEGSVLFADLLLNAGRPDNPVTEYQLEGEGGFRGVGEQSAEMQIFLPGSLGWTDEL